MSICDKYIVYKWHSTQFPFILYVNQIFDIFTYLMQIPKKLLMESYQYSIAILSRQLVLHDYTPDIECIVK